MKQLLITLMGGLVWLLAGGEPIRVSVTIPPMETIVREIGGEWVEVRSIQESGDSCEVFEPRPSRVEWLGRSELYFTVGVGAEVSLLQNAEKRFSRLEIISLIHDKDTHFCAACADHDHVHHHDEAEGDSLLGSTGDHPPHLWLVPEELIRMTEVIVRELSRKRPDGDEVFRKNRERLVERIESLDDVLSQQLESLRGQSFLVLHPSFGAFGEEYGLNELAISQTSFSFQPRTLQRVIQEARAQKVFAILLQPQESRKQAEALSKALNVPILEVNALDPDWFGQMHKIGQRLNNPFALGENEQ